MGVRYYLLLYQLLLQSLPLVKFILFHTFSRHYMIRMLIYMLISVSHCGGCKSTALAPWQVPEQKEAKGAPAVLIISR